jgi:uncharacterized protein YceK
MLSNGAKHISKKGGVQNRVCNLTGIAKPGQTQKARARISKSTFTRFSRFATLPGMLKKILPLMFVPLLMGGCAATLTNLTPTQQVRNANNLYPVEVALSSRQQAMRWNSIQPQIVVGTDIYPMRPTLLMTNRWEGLVPAQPGVNIVHYRYKFDFQVNAFGPAKADSATSQEYTLRILDQ